LRYSLNVILIQLYSGLTKYTKQFGSQTKLCVDSPDQHQPLRPLSTLVKELGASTKTATDIVDDHLAGNLSSRKNSIFSSKKTDEHLAGNLSSRKNSIFSSKKADEPLAGDLTLRKNSIFSSKKTDDHLGGDLTLRKNSIFGSKSTEHIPSAEFYLKTLGDRKGSIAKIFLDETIKIEKEQVAFR
jgi:hypothetical protein